MVYIQINLNEEQNRKVNVHKAKFDLVTKEEAILNIIDLLPDVPVVNRADGHLDYDPKVADLLFNATKNNGAC